MSLDAGGSSQRHPSFAWSRLRARRRITPTRRTMVA